MEETGMRTELFEVSAREVVRLRDRRAEERGHALTIPGFNRDLEGRATTPDERKAATDRLWNLRPSKRAA
jgi:hypothetical protein